MDEKLHHWRNGLHALMQARRKLMHLIQNYVISATLYNAFYNVKTGYRTFKVIPTFFSNCKIYL